MIRVLNFLQPIRDSLLKIKAKLCKDEKFEYRMVQYDTTPDQTEMNILGSDGWELISVNTTGADTFHLKYQFWFKRRL